MAECPWLLRYYFIICLRLYRLICCHKGTGVHSPIFAHLIYPTHTLMAFFSIRRILLLLPVLCLLASCSEDFTVGAPYKAITVVYGIMDVGDTAHYIRIQKAYYDENMSALV